MPRTGLAAALVMLVLAACGSGTSDDEQATLPSRPAPPTGGADDRPSVQIHQVVSGDSLSKLAREYCGATEAFIALFAANQGRLQTDGGALVDPSELQVGWELEIDCEAGEQGRGFVAADPTQTTAEATAAPREDGDLTNGTANPTSTEDDADPDVGATQQEGGSDGGSGSPAGDSASDAPTAKSPPSAEDPSAPTDRPQDPSPIVQELPTRSVRLGQGASPTPAGLPPSQTITETCLDDFTFRSMPNTLFLRVGSPAAPFEVQHGRTLFVHVENADDASSVTLANQNLGVIEFQLADGPYAQTYVSPAIPPGRYDVVAGTTEGNAFGTVVVVPQQQFEVVRPPVGGGFDVLGLADAGSLHVYRFTTTEEGTECRSEFIYWSAVEGIDNVGDSVTVRIEQGDAPNGVYCLFGSGGPDLLTQCDAGRGRQTVLLADKLE